MVLLGWMLFCLMLSMVRTETTILPKQETTSEAQKTTELPKQQNINVNEIPKIYALVYNPYLQNRVVSPPPPPNQQYNTPAKQFARQYVVLMGANNQQPQPQPQQIPRPNQPLQAIFINKNNTDQNIAASGHNTNQLPPGQSYMRIFIPGHGLHNFPLNQLNNAGVNVANVQNHGPVPHPQNVTPHQPCAHAHHVQLPGPSPTPARVPLHVFPIHPQGGAPPVISVFAPNNIKPIQHAPSNQVIQITPNVSPNGNVATHPLVKTYGIPVNPSVGRIGLLISPGVQN